MTQEDKELLLKDLSARLPYGVKTTYSGIIMEIFAVSSFLDNMCCLKWDSHKGHYNQTNARIGEFKPYLRPMSSMTEEERKEWYATFESVYDLVPGGDPYNEDDYDDNWHEEPGIESFDWLNAHHFDYRGLIEKGLALEAKDGMYNTRKSYEIRR